MQSALSVVRGNECKIIVNEKNAVQFCGSDARCLPLEIIHVLCCIDSTYLQYFWYSGDKSVKLKNDLNPFRIRIYLFLANTVFG